MRWRVAGWAVAVLVGLLMMYPAAGRPLPARAASAPIKVMPLGDSITAGTDQYSSYRCELLKKLAPSYNVDFVGTVHGQWGILERINTPPPAYCTYPNTDWDEEGHSGYDIAHIITGAASWPGKLQDWVAANVPDVVLIHLGTNNFSGNPDFPPPNVDDAVSQMGQVIDTLRAANPKVRILLAQILPCKCDVQNLILTFNNRLPTLAASKQRPFSPIIVVDMYNGFNFNDHFYSDGVHPNPTGEDKMARRWNIGFDQIMKINNWTFVPLAIK